MPPPVDPNRAFVVSRGRAVRTVSYREYDPGYDDGATDPHGTAESCSGVRGPKRVTGEGDRATTRATWTLTGLTARPVLRSLVVDGSDTWVVETADSDPAADAVYVTDCYLG